MGIVLAIHVLTCVNGAQRTQYTIFLGAHDVAFFTIKAGVLGCCFGCLCCRSSVPLCWTLHFPDRGDRQRPTQHLMPADAHDDNDAAGGMTGRRQAVA